MKIDVNMFSFLLLHLVQGYGVIEKCAQVLIDEIATCKYLCQAISGI